MLLLLKSCDLRPVPAAAWRSQVQDWSQLTQQAELVAAWPTHPFAPRERLQLAEALVQQGVLQLAPELCGQRLCDFYGAFCDDPRGLAPRPAAVAPALVALTAAEGLGPALHEAVALLLGGRAVALGAAGAELEALQAAVAGLPPALLRAVPLGPLATLPRLRSFRALGPRPEELWAERPPPGDFGGRGGVRHGMACAEGLALAEAAAGAPSEASAAASGWSEEAEMLAALLPKPIPEGELEEMRRFLALLWGFREPCENVALAPCHKHVLLTFCGSVLPEDLVKIAMTAAMSPFHERITLHAVGLGSRGLVREPLRSFCGLTQSGRPGLEWQVKEHKDWAAFLDWLPQQAEPINLFSLLRNLEPELRRRCAAQGGAAWVQLLLEPAERLRRWTCVVPADAQERRLRDDLQMPWQ
ncbi:unnamed protein product [Effrenium voratum]|nr:unnamed protein product [Effrenium voratum]